MSHSALYSGTEVVHINWMMKWERKYFGWFGSRQSWQCQDVERYCCSHHSLREAVSTRRPAELAELSMTAAILKKLAMCEDDITRQVKSILCSNSQLSISVKIISWNQTFILVGARRFPTVCSRVSNRAVQGRPRYDIRRPKT